MRLQILSFLGLETQMGLKQKTKEFCTHPIQYESFALNWLKKTRGA